MPCLWGWFGLNSCKAGLSGQCVLGSTAMGLETCAASLVNNWEFESRSKFLNTPVPPLVSKLLSANNITLLNLYRVTLDNPIQAFSWFCLSGLLSPTKNRTDIQKCIHTGYLCGMAQRFTILVISHPCIESKIQSFPILPPTPMMVDSSSTKSFLY